MQLHRAGQADVRLRLSGCRCLSAKYHLASLSASSISISPGLERRPLCLLHHGLLIMRDELGAKVFRNQRDERHPVEACSTPQSHRSCTSKRSLESPLSAMRTSAWYHSSPPQSFRSGGWVGRSRSSSPACPAACRERYWSLRMRAHSEAGISSRVFTVF